MIKKRLLVLLADASKYIKEQVIWKILGLLCQIVIVVCISLILANVAESSSNLLSGSDNVINARSYIKYIIPSIICILLRVVFDKKEADASYAASADVKKVLRSKIYQKLLSLGSSYKDKVSTAEVTQLLTEGVEQLETYFGQYLSQLFYSMISPFILFIVVATVSIKAAFILLIFVPLIPVSIVVVQKIAKRILNKYWSMYAELGDSFLENIQGLTTLKIYQSDKIAADKMDVESEHFRKVTMKVLTMQLNSTSVMDIMAYGGAAAGIITALSGFFNSSISLYGTIMIILLSAEFFLPMRKLGSFFHIAMNGMAASDKIFNLLDLDNPEEGTEDFPIDNRNITFDKVFFSYNKDVEIEASTQGDIYLAPSNSPDEIGLINKTKEKGAVLKGISMEIPQGKFTAIVGVSGSGKSTIASLIMGRQKDYKGCIKIGDIEISSIKESELYKNITIVSTNSNLFKGTIRENLQIAKENVSDEEMLDALKKVNLLELNNKEVCDNKETTTNKEIKDRTVLDINLLEGASNLSGGERQRLSIARALIHDTNIYIFDEATSNIDAESEEMIMTVIKEIAKTHTVILITHRLANVESADLIYMLKDGTIVEKGNHKSLMGHFGSYSFLYNAQKKLENFNGGKCKTEEMPVQNSKENSILKSEETNVKKSEENNVKKIEECSIKKSEENRIKKIEECSVKNAEENSSKKIEHSNFKEESIHAKRKRRSALFIMGKLIILVKPLIPIMILAITFGILGFICAIFLTVRASVLVAGYGSFSAGFAFSLIIMAILRGLLHYAEQYCNHFIAFKLLAIIRHKVFAALRALAPAKLEGKDKGNIIAILTSDIELLEVFYAHTISPIAIAIIMTVIMVTYECRINPIFGVISLFSYIVIGIVIPYINSQKGAEIGLKYRNEFGEMNSFVLESLRGLDETIQYDYGQKRKQEIEYKSVFLSTIQKALSGQRGEQVAITNLIIQISTWIMLIAVVYISAINFENTSEGIVAVVALMSSFGPVIALSNLSNNLNQTLASGDRVISLLEEIPEVIENQEGAKVIPPAENIFTENLSFSYGEKQILSDLSIGFPRGQIIGIHGASGCGKSTLLKLLMRFYDTDKGSVKIIAGNENPFEEHIKSKETKVDSNETKEAINERNIKDNLREIETDTQVKDNSLSTTYNQEEKNAYSESENTSAIAGDQDSKTDKPMSALEMLRAMQAQEKEKERVKKEHEDAFLKKSMALAKQKEEARRQATIEAEKVEKQNQMSLEERLSSFLPSKAEQTEALDIKNIRTTSLRKLQSYVTQDTYIFHDTIANNIKVAKPMATMEEIEDAAKKASLHDFILSLPDKYETIVGELGDTLSGGEKQRIGIARAFLNDTDIILLDEPTSNLDSLNEGIILKALKDEAKDKIIIIVSHRESTMAVADNVYSFI